MELIPPKSALRLFALIYEIENDNQQPTYILELSKAELRYTQTLEFKPK